MQTDYLERMRVVIDTNVLVGAMVATICPKYADAKQQLDKRVVQYALSHCDVVFTHATMGEFRDVATDLKGRTHGLGPSHVFARIQYVDHLQKILRPWMPGETALHCRDPKDVMFLKAAQGAKALFIISRDKDILELKHEGPCRFVTPHFFSETVMPKPVEPTHQGNSIKKHRPAWRPQRMEQLA